MAVHIAPVLPEESNFTRVYQRNSKGVLLQLTALLIFLVDTWSIIPFYYRERVNIPLFFSLNFHKIPVKIIYVFLQVFQHEASKKNICIAVQEKVPSNADETKFKTIITNLLVKPARAVVLFTRADDAK